VSHIRAAESLSVGIIGAGQIVTNVHLPSLLATQGVSVAWVADSNPEKARALARAYRVEHRTIPDNLSELPEADILLLAIPFGAREPYYRALCSRTSALYVEKPFSRDTSHHREICSMFAEHKLGVAFQRRSWAHTQLVRQLIASELFGNLGSIRYGFGAPGIISGGRYSADLRLAGGGILFETGVHGIDALLFVTGATSVRVEKAKMVMDGGFDLHTEADLSLTTGKGQAVVCELRVSCLQETIQRMELTFDHAVVSFSLFSQDGVKVEPRTGGSSYRLTDPSLLYPLTVLQSYSEHFFRFSGGLRAGTANWTSASSTAMTTEVIENLYRAGSNGSPQGGGGA